MSYYKVTGTSSYIKLTGSYGYNTSTIDGLAANTTVDGTTASWNISNSANQYPSATVSYLDGSDPINLYGMIVYNAGADLTLNGGTIIGSVPQTSDWLYTYNNSAALRIENASSINIDNWTIDKVWDGIRFKIGADNWLIDDTHLSNVRDDAVEDDFKNSGTIRDSLFDGVFSGISLVNNTDHVDGSANTVTLDHTFIRMESYLTHGEMTHQSPFKSDTDVPGTMPDIRIVDSVIAIEDVTHNGIERLKVAWENVVESHGNVFLNLSDTALPSTYPKPPAGFTILQGQEARDYWAKVKAAWLDNHDGTPNAELTQLPPLPGQEPAPAPAPEPTPEPTSPTTDPTSPTAQPAPTQPAPTPTTGKTITGTKAVDTLTGTSGNDVIDAKAKGDFLYGKGGSDVLTGGTGWDKFVFDTALDGSVDKITDFNPADDSIYLDNAIFTKLGSGSLSSPVKLNSSWLEDGAGVHANDSNDYIIYDKTTGHLSYDADGSGAGAAITFAHLPTGLDLTNGDFFVV